jgi:hypothetical protein
MNRTASLVAVFIGAMLGVAARSHGIEVSVVTLPVAADAPSITHVPVTRVRSGEDFVVEARVSGTRPIARVMIAYHAGDRFGGVPLQRTDSGVYRARVSAARLGRTSQFRYIIFATDEGGRASTWPPAPSRAGEPPGQLVTVSD